MNIKIAVSIPALNKNVQKKARPVLDKAILNNTNQDEFINSDIYKNNNLQFKIKHIKFFKEDEEKMANMSLTDKIKLKS